MVDGFNFVDAHAGTAHIDSTSIARKNMIVTGYSDAILPLHNRFKVTILDATHIQLWNGGGFIKGRFFYCDIYTKMEVKAGTNGLNRWDALVIRYHRGSDGVETVTPLIITGNATSGQPSLPPTLVNNDPLTGATDADLLLGRIELNGTNLSYTALQENVFNLRNAFDDIKTARDTLTKSINDEKSARQNGDNANANSIKSVESHVGNVENALNSFKRNIENLEFRKLVSDPDWNLSGIVVNNVAIISLRWANKGGFHIGAWSSDHPVAEITNGWKCDYEAGNWSIDNSYYSDNWFSLYDNRIIFRSRSSHDIAANTWHLCTITAYVHK